METQKKILLIEDDIATASLLTTVLCQNEWNVSVVYSGERALEKIDSFNPDIIILDLLLPGMSGFDVLRKIRGEKKYKKPIVILSNLSSDRDREESFSAGATEYLVKSSLGIKDIVQVFEKYKQT